MAPVFLAKQSGVESFLSAGSAGQWPVNTARAHFSAQQPYLVTLLAVQWEKNLGNQCPLYTQIGRKFYRNQQQVGNLLSSSARFFSPIQKKKRWEGASIRVTFWNLLRTTATLADTSSRFTKADFLFLRTSICPRYPESAKGCRSTHSLTWTRLFQSAALPSVLCGSRTKVAFIFLRFQFNFI